MRNEQEQKKWEMQAYGMTSEDIEKEIKASLFVSNSFYATCILSDVQELIEIASTEDDRQLRNWNLEKARQLINKSKYVMNRRIEG